jgi:hypothetical protein
MTVIQVLVIVVPILMVISLFFELTPKRPEAAFWTKSGRARWNQQMLVLIIVIALVGTGYFLNLYGSATAMIAALVCLGCFVLFRIIFT